MACGMSVESGEPVVLTCTEATASRNYLPALTEAFYRKISILAITATAEITLIGQNHPQMIDRSVIAKDIVVKSLFLPIIYSAVKEEGYINCINDALLELRRNGGGPVHIQYEKDFSAIGCTVVYLDHTDNISSSLIREKINNEIK